MREGGITRAAQKLCLAPSTVSAQLAKFEESLGYKLFNRVSRRLEPTDIGHLVFRYADEIFTLGREMQDALRGLPVSRPLSLKVGIVEAVPKLVAQKLLEPVSGMTEQVRLICHEGKEDNLLAELAMHGLDVVLTDTPLRSGLSIKAYSHLLGECCASFFGEEGLASRLRGDFPHSLDKAPMLLPMPMSTLRNQLDQWFAHHKVHPRIMGEFDDSALLKVFGQSGAGFFVAPSVIEKEVMRQYQVRLIGRSCEIREKFYAISVERIIRHPAVAAISEAAHKQLFFECY